LACCWTSSRFFAMRTSLDLANTWSCRIFIVELLSFKYLCKLLWKSLRGSRFINAAISLAYIHEKFRELDI
jgi:hypothetical protein